jgi:hypothetical protein
MKRLSEPMKRALRNLRDGKPGNYYLVGRSEHGGYTATIAALYARKLVDPDTGNLTAEGRAIAEKLP